MLDDIESNGYIKNRFCAFTSNQLKKIHKLYFNISSKSSLFIFGIKTLSTFIPRLLSKNFIISYVFLIFDNQKKIILFFGCFVNQFLTLIFFKKLITALYQLSIF